MIYNHHEILLRKNAKVDYTLDDNGKVIEQDQIHIETEFQYVVRGWNPNPFDSLDEIKNAIDEYNSSRHNEKMALVAYDILGAFRDEYREDVLKEHVRRSFKNEIDGEDDVEALTQELEELLSDITPDYLRENDIENALSQIVACYDNGGKTIDRYCVVTTDKEGDENYIISLSHNCDMPNGVAMAGLGIDGDHLGQKIDFYQLPETVQTKVTHMLNYIEA